MPSRLQRRLIQHHALTAVERHLVILAQLQGVGGASLGAQAAEHAAAQVVSPRDDFFALGRGIALALHHDELLGTGQRAQVANDAQRLAGIRIRVQARLPAETLEDHRALQRILLSNCLTGRLIVERNLEALYQINQENLAKQRIQLHCSTPSIAADSCGMANQIAVAISTPKPVGSSTFQPTFMSWSKR